ncbi:MAG: PKD domain-containing protein [Bacteroidia bacterium]
MFNDTSKAAANDPIVDWHWSFGDDDQTTTKGINPVFTYQTYREYKVCLTITTESDCKDTYCKVIRLKDPRKASELLNLSPQPPVHISIDSLRTSRLAPLWPLIRLSIALLLLFLLIFYELYKRNKKQLALSRETSKNGPYNWPLQFPHQAEIYPDEVFHKVATHLRQRQFSEILELDMDRTIESTLNSGGFPSFEYSFGTRPSEYLVLIERSNFKDHQARLYELLAEQLGSQDIFIDVYYYQSDFRMYWKDLTERPIYLKELKVRHPNHRLIILGDGEHLLDPVYGDLNYDAFEFLEWKDRAVLTPIPPSEWGFRVKSCQNFMSATSQQNHFLLYWIISLGRKTTDWNLGKKWSPYHPPLQILTMIMILTLKS